MSLKLPEPVDLSFYKIDGKDPSKTPIMIYHGIFSEKSSWNEFAKQISEQSKRTVYCFDIRNHGDSPWTKEFSLKAAISDLVHFLNKNKINRAIFLGHSLGGLTFSRLATLFPDLVEKLVIVDIHPKKETSESKNVKLYGLFLKQVIQTIRDEKITDLELAKKRLDELLKTHTKEDQNRKKSLDRIIIRDGQVDWKFNLDLLIEFLANLGNSVKDEDIIPNYTGPSLEIYGGKSMIFSKDDCESVLNFLPNCKFECIEDAGHSPHNTHPKEFIGKVLPFLNA